jgi:mono/diheme cytochrome c family protein/uncharacterized membrane protein
MGLAASMIVLSAVVVDLPHAPAAPSDGPDVAGRLYHEYCQRCHGADGKGDGDQPGLPARPDFTRRGWQQQRKDAQLVVSILDGKGTGMPSFRDRLGEAQATTLVAHVRAFAPARSSAPATPPAAPTAAPDQFDKEWRRLQDNYDELKKQMKELDSAPRRPAKAASGAAKGRAEADGADETARSTGALYREHCQRCHGADGRGGRDQPDLGSRPDFASSDWQKRRDDDQLLRSILDGKGKEMPPWREKISEEQARGLVAYVRAFAPAGKTSGEEGRTKPPLDDWGERQRRLREDVDDLQRQVRQLAKASPDREPSKPSETSSRATTPPPAPRATLTPAARDLFRRRCATCHGEDGTGNPARDRLPEIPDFTDISWQGRQDDARLLQSILDGKGKEMPPWRGKITEELARDLVTRVRSFASTTEWSQHEEEGGPPSPATVGDKPPRGFFETLIGWLGKFHPATVHFPIALLTAAALAELLRMATSKLALDAAARYCLWLGALSAGAAGVLGWFLAGFRVADATGVLTAHRWLGTATVAWAGLVLLLGEVSRRPDRRRPQSAFRAMLLVTAVLALVTGFFGGAVVYGLDHYAWPP